MATYIAESRAAYGLIADYQYHPDTYEERFTGAPIVIATGEDERIVRHELSMHLIKSTGGMQADQQKVYFAASNAITDGVDAVQVGGRVYRIRKES